MPPVPSPSLNTTYVLAVVAALVSLALTQSFITDKTAELVTGLASIFVPLVLAAAQSFVHAHVAAASIRAEAYTASQTPSQVKAAK